MEVKKLILGTSLKFTPIIIRNHIHMLITLVLFIIRLCAFLVKRLPMFCFPVIRNDVEVLPVISTEGSYCAINVTNVGDYIDYEHTKAKLFKSSGRIMSFLALLFSTGCNKEYKHFSFACWPEEVLRIRFI